MEPSQLCLPFHRAGPSARVSCELLCPVCVLKKIAASPLTPAAQDDGRADTAKLLAEFDIMKAEIKDLKKSLNEQLNVNPEGSHEGSPLDAGDTLRAQQKIIESHERALRRNNVIIVGLPDEGTQASADEEVSKMLADRLQLQDLRFEARRLGKKVGDKCRPILVQFHDQKTKLSVMRKQAMLKGHNLYINDDLTPFQRRNQISLLARMKAARNEGKSALFSRGRLLIDGSSVASLDSFDSL